MKSIIPIAMVMALMMATTAFAQFTPYPVLYKLVIGNNNAPADLVVTVENLNTKVSKEYRTNQYGEVAFDASELGAVSSQYSYRATVQICKSNSICVVDRSFSDGYILATIDLAQAGVTFVTIEKEVVVEVIKEVPVPGTETVVEKIVEVEKTVEVPVFDMDQWWEYLSVGGAGAGFTGLIYYMFKRTKFSRKDEDKSQFQKDLEKYILENTVTSKGGVRITWYTDATGKKKLKIAHWHPSQPLTWHEPDVEHKTKKHDKGEWMV